MYDVTLIERLGNQYSVHRYSDDERSNICIVETLYSSWPDLCRVTACAALQ